MTDEGRKAWFQLGYDGPGNVSVQEQLEEERTIITHHKASLLSLIRNLPSLSEIASV